MEEKMDSFSCSLCNATISSINPETDQSKTIKNSNAFRFICWELKIIGQATDTNRLGEDELLICSLCVPLCDDIARIIAFIEEIKLQLTGVICQIQDRIHDSISSDSVPECRSKEDFSISKEPNLTNKNTAVVKVEAFEHVGENLKSDDEEEFTLVDSVAFEIKEEEEEEVEADVREMQWDEDALNPDTVYSTGNLNESIEKENDTVTDSDRMEVDMLDNTENTDTGREPCVRNPEILPRTSKEPVESKSDPESATAEKLEPRADPDSVLLKKTYNLTECEICVPRLKFVSAVELAVHYDIDHKDTEPSYICTRFGCEERFLCKELLFRHEKSHSLSVTREASCSSFRPSLATMYCRFCGKCSYYPELLRHHEIHEHPETLTYPCILCGKRYSHPALVEAHSRTHCLVSSVFTCSICPEDTELVFDDPAKLDDHIIIWHNMMTKRPTHLEEDSEDEIPGKQSLACKSCRKVFTAPGQMRNHLCKSRTAMFRCELCEDVYFTFETDLINHTVTVHEGSGSQITKTLSCPRCSKTFATNFMLKRHLNSYNFEEDRPYQCTQCEQRFLTETEFRYHENGKHIDRKKMQPNRNCSICSQKLKKGTLYELRKHEREKHPELFVFHCPKASCLETFTKEEFLKTHFRTHELVGPYSCSVCKQSVEFDSGEQLETHLKQRHTEGVWVQCPECNIKCGNGERSLIWHMATSHGHPWPLNCPQCGKGLASQGDLNRHQRETHESGPQDEVVCDICGQTLKGKGLTQRLKHHIAVVHERAELRICEICGKMITSSGSFKMHMKSHREEKDYVCYFCNKRFVRRDALRYHIYTHTKELPFGCHICGRKFNQMAPRKTHFDVHKKNGTWFPKKADSGGQESDQD